MNPQTPVAETASTAIGIVGKIGVVSLALILSASLLVLTIKIFLKLWRVVRGVANPLPVIAAPDAYTALPMRELEELAERSVLRLRSAYRLHFGFSVVVATTIGLAFIWSLVMVTIRWLNYATVFGGGGLGVTVLAMKWQPFDRVGRARDLAEQADVMATGLRLRMTTISCIEDPMVRHNEEWKAVREYTSEALGVRRAEGREAAVSEACPSPRTVKRPRRRAKASTAARS